VLQWVKERFLARISELAAEATARQTFRNFFPDIVASGTYGGTRSEFAEIFSYGVQLNWSIFDGSVTHVVTAFAMITHAASFIS